MGFIVEHECPQCGAPIELEETSRLLRCPYCDVKNFLTARDCFRFVLPQMAAGKDIIYTPYMRFKGVAYLCTGTAIDQRFIDITRLGAPFKMLPLSLGFKPQAIKLRYVTPDLTGSFLTSTLEIDDVLNTVGKQTSGGASETCFHRSYVGEALSLIYLPTFVNKKKLYDAVTNQTIASLPGGKEIFSPGFEKNPRWQITFMATICPKCGWDMDGEKDSVVLTCKNCDSAWEASDSTFARIDLVTVPAKKGDAFYLPFWKIAASSDQELEINSYADFIRITNQPKVVQQGWENQPMSFWIPAFKIRPRVFLKLSKHITLAQNDFEMTDEVPGKNLHPVTLPLAEAVQGIKVTLASSIMNKGKLFPCLPKVSFTVGNTVLVYLPFHDAGREIVQEQMQISVQKKTLEYGRYL